MKAGEYQASLRQEGLVPIAGAVSTVSFSVAANEVVYIGEFFVSGLCASNTLYLHVSDERRRDYELAAGKTLGSTRP
jgi:hypothetical protein